MRFQLGLRPNLTDVLYQLSWQDTPQYWTANGQYLVRSFTPFTGQATAGADERDGKPTGCPCYR